MTGHPEPLGARVRALLGQARLVYWDDAALSETLQGYLDRLEAPLRVAIRAPEGDAEALAAAVAEAGAALDVVAERPDAVVALLDPAAPPGADLPPAESLVGVLPAGGDPAALPDAVARRFRRVVAAADPDALAGALRELAEDADPLRALGSLAGLRRVLADHPRHGSEKVAADAERLEAFAPERRELAAAVALRGGRVAGVGPAATARALAVLAAARHLDRSLHRPRELDLDAELASWRTAAQDPTLPRESRAIAVTVARACERLLAGSGGRGSGAVPDQRP
nr:hypothetical protein [Propionibacterium sp.]